MHSLAQIQKPWECTFCPGATAVHPDSNSPTCVRKSLLQRNYVVLEGRGGGEGQINWVFPISTGQCIMLPCTRWSLQKRLWRSVVTDIPKYQTMSTTTQIYAACWQWAVSTWIYFQEANQRLNQLQALENWKKKLPKQNPWIDKSPEVKSNPFTTKKCIPGTLTSWEN